MTSTRRLPAIAVAIVLAASATAGADTLSDILNQVSQASYTNYLDNTLYTHDGSNRGLSGAQHDPAQTNISSALSGFGLATSLDPFTYGGGTYYNVVGVHLGAVRPNTIYLVGAHYDSVGNPGADDDGSGVAGVLEAARVLAKYKFEATLIFMAFDREEQGLIGSGHYANEHSADTIAGMISLDMIAYNPPGEHHDKAFLYGRDASLPIKQALGNAITAYGNGLTFDIGGDQPYSDHAPFEAVGKQACLLIEHALSSNPYYHQANDSVDTAGYIDYQYATNLTRSVVGYLATEAVVVPEPSIAVLLVTGGVVLCWGTCRRRARRG
jgi:hypothetical protein